MKFRIVILFFLLITSQLKGEGLYFHSYEVNKDARTSLNLTPQKAINLQDGFELSFDLKLRRNVHNFGYILRMIIGDKQNLDLVTSASSPSRSYFLVAGNENKLTFSEKNTIHDDQSWTHITIRYSQKTDELTLKVDETIQKAKLNGTIQPMNQVSIFFGGAQHHLFSTTDVAPMTLRNIELARPNGKSYFWELCKHGNDEVLDERQNALATVIHPLWLIDRKACWQHVSSVKLPQRQSWAFNEDKSELYISGPKHIYVYNLTTDNFTDTIHPKYGTCFYSNASRLLFDNRNKRLISYEIDSTEVETFDFDRQSWNRAHKTNTSPRFWHHNHFIDTHDSALYCFGGYGYHQYKSQLNKYSFETKQWTSADLSRFIYPRYLAALGQSDDKIYIFGGYGSKTGEQQVAPRFFYDLFEMDIPTQSVKKIWEYDNPKTSFVQGNSMIINAQDSCFYTLCYSSEHYHTTISLNRFSLNSPERTVLADSIPFLFNDTESMCDLFLDRKNQKLIALTLMLNTDNLYEINIYTLAYPPIPFQNVYQNKKSISGWHLGLIGIIILGLAIGMTLYCLKRRRITGANKPDTGQERVETEQLEIPVAEPENSVVRSAIILLGGFQVLGADGNDITGSFTPTLRNLLILILLNTVSKGKGISSELLIERFWYDKGESSARNNLSVNIKRLRSLLEQIGSVQVIHSNGYWIIELEEPVICDYQIVKKQLECIRLTPDALTETEIAVLLQQISKGALLPSIQNEWADDYKAEYTNQAIDILRMILDIPAFHHPGELRIKTCDAILMLDPLDEDALIEKCRILYLLGRKGQAKRTYDIYCKNYQALLSSDFKESFDEIIKNS